MTIEIITVRALASRLDLATNELDNNPRAGDIVADTNGLISDAWRWPRNPVPTGVRLVALKVARRAWWAPADGKSLESVTRSGDNQSRTDRWRANPSDPDGGDVYLTAAERRYLAGPRRGRSIRTHVPLFS